MTHKRVLANFTDCLPYYSKTMDKENRTKPNFVPQRKREYRLYLLWKALPPNMKRLGRAYAEGLGIDDEDLLQRLEIKTQKEFSEKFGLSETHISEVWNVQPIPAEYKDIDWRSWAKKLTHNVVHALYEGIIEDKDAQRIKLWLQAVDNFVEESKVTEDIGKETLGAVRDIVEKIRNEGNRPRDNSGDGGDDSPAEA